MTASHMIRASLPHYGLAILHPIVIIGIITLGCLATGVVDTDKINWPKAANNVLTAAAITFPLSLLTEKGFVRGWLFGSL